MNKRPLVRITKRFSFEAAHALDGYDGLCKNIHGHSYILYVTLKGRVSEKPDDPKLGMLIDFSSLKSIINDNIIKKFDHALMVKEGSELTKSGVICKIQNTLISLPFQPTCENLIVYFAEIISKLLPDNITLHSLKLYETETSYAEWHLEDNL